MKVVKCAIGIEMKVESFGGFSLLVLMLKHFEIDMKFEFEVIIMLF